MGAMTAGNNPTDRSKPSTKRHILTDKNGVPLSAVITSVQVLDIKAGTEVIDNVIVKRPNLSSFTKERRRRRKRYQHLCLDKSVQLQICKIRNYQTRICASYTPKRKRGERTSTKTTHL